MKIFDRNPSELIPYQNNSRIHSPKQIDQICSSIKEFGFTNPILIDKKGQIIAGHGRVEAAKKLEMAFVPCIELSSLSKEQIQAYVIADNQLAMNAEWDMEMLKIEIGDLAEHDFDISLLGFGDDFLDEMFPEEFNGVTDESGNPYTSLIKAPNYEPVNEKPDIDELVDKAKRDELIKKIKDSKVSADEKKFLLLAAERHTVFDFGKIADFYAHSEEEMQNLMEESALVIIDFDKAIEGGFVRMTKQIIEQYEIENSEESEDDE